MLWYQSAFKISKLVNEKCHWVVNKRKRILCLNYLFPVKILHKMHLLNICMGYNVFRNICVDMLNLILPYHLPMQYLIYVTKISEQILFDLLQCMGNRKYNKFLVLSYIQNHNSISNFHFIICNNVKLNICYKNLLLCMLCHSQCATYILLICMLYLQTSSTFQI